jgi:hypothetical protein
MTVETHPGHLDTSPPDTPGPATAQPPSKGRTAMGWAVGAIGLGLAVYSAIGSYKSIVELAKRLDVPSPDWVPIGIDGGLFGVVLLDLFATAIGRPIGWLRSVARVFTIGTVVVNGMSGWKTERLAWDNVQSVTLHIFAPLLFLVLVEATRELIMWKIAKNAGELADTIPWSNWWLQFWPTFLTWRRMRLQKIPSRTVALAMESRRRRAIALLKIAHPGFRRWRKAAPADLVYDLLRGFNLDDRCRQVDAMRITGPMAENGRRTAPENGPRTPLENTSGNGVENGPRTPSGTGSRTPGEPPSGNTLSRPGTPPKNGRPKTSRNSLAVPPRNGAGDTPENTPDTGGENAVDRFEEQLNMLDRLFPPGVRLPGINAIREALKQEGLGCGAPRAADLQRTMAARRNVPLPTEENAPQMAVNGTNH